MFLISLLCLSFPFLDVLIASDWVPRSHPHGELACAPSPVREVSKVEKVEKRLDFPLWAAG